ncbi:MAG: DVUA0089 family protein [Polyangiales bacterium]
MALLRSRVMCALLLTGGLTGACSSNGGGGGGGGDTDAAATTDTPTADTPTADAPRTDASSDARADASSDARADAPVVNPCASPRDLTGMAPGADGTLHVTGDSSASSGVGVGMIPTSCTQGAKGHAVVFQYTMRTTAVLRVSTANMGTDTAFDTVVAVLPSCGPVAPLACNDDVGSSDTRSTATTAATVMSGTRVFIAVGGFGDTPENADSGRFELTIAEVQPRASGAACTATDICATGTRCLSSPTMPGTTICVPDGTNGGACMTGRTCMTGLTCNNIGLCRMPLAMGATCTPTDACPANAHCVPVNPDGSLRRCLADGALGAACRVTGTACDMGACSAMMPTATAPGVCRTLVAAGMACDTSHGCMTGAHCLPLASDPTMTTCQTDGVAGAICRTTAPFCDMGLACSSSNPMTSAGICRATVAGTGACDLTGRTNTCTDPAECAPNATFSAGACAAPGTAAGVSCRTAAPFCDTGLTCSAMTPSAADPGVCQRAAAAGAACDYHYLATVCGGSTVCAPTSAAAGTCAMPRAEAEPNNTPMAPMTAVAASTVFQGAITPGTDVDCYAVTVPANGSLYLETTDGQDGCPAGADTFITLYNSAGAVIGYDDDGGIGLCSALDGVRAGPAHRLAAGSYVACVSAYGGAAGPAAISRYFLTVGLVP